MKGSFRKRGCKCPKGKGKKCTCGATWSFRIDIGIDPKTGKRKQPEFTGYATRAIAETACADMIVKYSQGDLSAAAGNETVESFMRKYLETVLKNEVEGQTHDGKVAIMENHILPELGHIKLQKLTSMQIQDFINNLIKSLSAGTIQNIMRLVNQTLNKAVEWGYVTKNVASFTSKPFYKPKRLDVWTKDQFQHFLKSSVNSRFFPFYLIGLTAGLRPGETRALSWEKHIDFKTNKIHIDSTVAITKEKGIHIKPSPKNDSSIRSVSVPEKVMNYLKKYKLSQPPNEFDLVIPGIKGPICYESVVEQVMKKDISAAGLPHLTPHGLRHTFATYLLSPPPYGLGQSVTAVSEILGHAKTTTTWNTYSHALPKMQESISVTLNNALDTWG